MQPAMVIYGPTVPWAVASLRGVDVFAGRSVGKYFRSRKRARAAGPLSWEEAARSSPPPSGCCPDGGAALTRGAALTGAARGGRERRANL